MGDSHITNKWLSFFSAYLIKNQALLYLFLILVSVHILGDLIKRNPLLLKRPATVTLAVSNGLFASANPSEQSEIQADRQAAGPWEQFHVVKVNDSSYRLLDPWDREFVQSRDGIIRSGDLLADGEAGFYLITLPDGKCRVTDRSNNFWCLSADSTRVLSGPEEQAVHFTPTIVDPAIPVEHGVLLWLALGFLGIALVVFRMKGRDRYAIFALLAAAFCYRLYAITLYDFLFVWDEQYHAVVARNLTDNPLMPLLRKFPVLPYDYRNWIGNHIWLHKQPLFLWQMALFINLLGEHAWVIRIPDLIATTLMVWIIYRMGTLLVSTRVGFIAAFLFFGSHFLFLLTSGSQFTAHNDVIFLFYITMSLWAWIEYSHSKSRKRQLIFLLLAGLFAGCAILNKWLVGLLLYSGWGIYILVSGMRRRVWRSYFDLGLSLVVCILVALPWQLYILQAFPQESLYEYSLNTEHFFRAVEGHGDEGLGVFYYFANFDDIFGVSLLVATVGLLFLFVVNKNREENWVVSTWIIVPILFYSAAATKMPAFPFITAPLIYLCVAALLFYLEGIIDSVIRNRVAASIFFILILVYTGNQVIKPNTLIFQNCYAARNPDSCPHQRREFAEAFRQLAKNTPVQQQEQYVIINCPWEEIGQILFYTHIKAAYGSLDAYNFSVLKKKSAYPVRYLIYNNKPIPDFILNDSTVLFIKIGTFNFNEDKLRCTD